jgi:hypothetical protein
MRPGLRMLRRMSANYEAANGVGLLLIELVRLHLLETGSDYHLPWSYNNT